MLGKSFLAAAGVSISIAKSRFGMLVMVGPCKPIFLQLPQLYTPLSRSILGAIQQTTPENAFSRAVDNSYIFYFFTTPSGRREKVR